MAALESLLKKIMSRPEDLVMVGRFFSLVKEEEDNAHKCELILALVRSLTEVDSLTCLGVLRQVYNYTYGEEELADLNREALELIVQVFEIRGRGGKVTVLKKELNALKAKGIKSTSKAPKEASHRRSQELADTMPPYSPIGFDVDKPGFVISNDKVENKNEASPDDWGGPKIVSLSEPGDILYDSSLGHDAKLSESGSVEEAFGLFVDDYIRGRDEDKEPIKDAPPPTADSPSYSAGTPIPNAVLPSANLSPNLFTPSPKAEGLDENASLPLVASHQVISNIVPAASISPKAATAVKRKVVADIPSPEKNTSKMPPRLLKALYDYLIPSVTSDRDTIIQHLDTSLTAYGLRLPKSKIQYLAETWQKYSNEGSSDSLEDIIGFLFYECGIDAMRALLHQIQYDEALLIVWSIYLNWLIHRKGKARRALYEIRQTIGPDSNLKWAEVAWVNMGVIWSKLALVGFSWRPEDGIQLLVENLRRREIQSFKGLAVLAHLSGNDNQ